MSWKIAMQFTNNSIWMKLRTAPDAKHKAAKAGCAWLWIDKMKCPALSEVWHDANLAQFELSKPVAPDQWRVQMGQRDTVTLYGRDVRRILTSTHSQTASAPITAITGLMAAS